MTRDRAARWVLLSAIAIALYTCIPSVAIARQAARMHATLTPERLGQGTTIGFSFEIAGSGGAVPSPLTAVEVRYPVAFAFGLSELGLARCSLAALDVFGLDGCPANSLMGYGTATAEIPFGPLIVRENAEVTIVRTVDQNGHVALLIYAHAYTPVTAEVVIPSLVVDAPAPYGGGLQMNVPLVESLPGAPDVALIQFHSTLGPQHIRYHEYIHGRRFSYQPKGIPLPEHCPSGGFQFAASFTFLDRTHTSAHATVACPYQKPRRRLG